MEKKRSRRRLVIGGVVATFALCVTTAGVVNNRADAAWQEMTERGEQLRQRCLAAPTTRAVLCGEPTDDNAFDHYKRIQELIEPVNEALTIGRLELRNLANDEFVDGIQEQRERWLPALAALRAGARSRDISHELGTVDGQVANLLAYRSAVNAAMFEARARRIEGDHLESVRWMLDAATLGGDCVRQGILINQMIGAALIAIVAEESAEVDLAQLSPAALEKLATGLEAIDEGLPDQLPMGREFLYMFDHLEAAQDLDSFFGGGSWRYGFSTRWMLADAYLTATDMHEHMREASTDSWPAREEKLNREAKARTENSNPMVGMMLPHLASAEANLRHTKASLRLLRMEVDIRRGLEPTPLADPLGNGPIAITNDADGYLLRSVGIEGNAPVERRVR